CSTRCRTETVRLGIVMLAMGAAVLAAPSSLSGCGSSAPATSASGADCTMNPLSCKLGETCWPVDDTPHFQCLKSQASNGFQASCQQTIGAPTCGDRLTCDQAATNAPGVCTFYCDDAMGVPCPNGYDCRITHVGSTNGQTIQLCRVTQPEPDGGGAP